jgi:hypothetical protein
VQRGTSYDVERKRVSKEYSHTIKCREREKSECRKEESKPRALMNCQGEREREVTPLKKVSIQEVAEITRTIASAIFVHF